MRNKLRFRPAAAFDAHASAALVHTSGPRLIDYGFQDSATSGEGFVAYAFADGRGLFGWRNHVVALLDGQVVGICAGYGLARYARMTVEHTAQLQKFYGMKRVFSIVQRNWHLSSLMPPPGPREHYVAHVAVRPEMRGLGVGRAIIEQQIESARRLGRRRLALDVEVSNAPARALYERCGLRAGTVHQFTGPIGRVPNTQRMTIDL